MKSFGQLRSPLRKRGFSGRRQETESCVFPAARNASPGCSTRGRSARNAEPPTRFWTPLSGRATLHSYVINHRPPLGYGSAGPYIIAIVALAEGFKMMTNLVNVEPTPENLQLDMELQVEFEDRGEWRVPVFRPAESDSRAAEVHGEG